MRVLIVSPHFPPVNAPDMQRVRMSLPYFREFGWQPYVLAVAPASTDATEPLLVETLPANVSIERVRSLSPAIARRLGFGNTALRALPFLYTAGSRIIAREHIDLVYFSTTMFLSMPLGRVWRRRFGVPYVLDIQDPWVSDYYDTHPESAPPPKYSVARRVHGVLEPWTMKKAGALIAVSTEYLASLQRRYPWLTDDMCTTLPFGMSQRDFEVLNANPQPNTSFDASDGAIHGAYVGRAGDDMKPALRILFDSLRRCGAAAPGLFGRVQLHFVGTDYATDLPARKTVEPVANALGVGAYVHERTGRVPYFEALQTLADASFLILIGSDDAGYTASKAYPYLMSGKPVVAVLHERSGLVPVLRSAAAATVVTFDDGDTQAAVDALTLALRRLMERLPVAPIVDDQLMARFSAREMARRQCVVFDTVQRRGGLRAA